MLGSGRENNARFADHQARTKAGGLSLDTLIAGLFMMPSTAALMGRRS